MRGGYRHGQGKMTWSNGTIFEGEWAQGFATGYGILNLPWGASYQGNWLNNRYHGQGEETWAEGSKFIGQYKNGNKSGHGTYYWKEGTKYTGDWVDNKL